MASLPFKLGKPLWSTTTCLYKHTFCQMLILPIRFHCKIFPLPTIANNCQHARSYCWQMANFTMGPNEQYPHFAEFRQKVCLCIHVVELQRDLPSLDCELERFVSRKSKKQLPNSSQTDYSHHLLAPSSHRTPTGPTPVFLSLVTKQDLLNA